MTEIERNVQIQFFIVGLLMLQILTDARAQDFDLKSDLLSFCEYQGMKYLTILSEEQSGEVRLFLSSLIYKSKSEYNDLRTNHLSFQRVVKDELSLKYDQDVLVIVASINTKRWKDILTLISKTKIKRSLLVIVGRVSHVQLEYIVKEIKEIQENMYFYLIYKSSDNSDDSKTKFYIVISVKGNEKVIIQALDLSKAGLIKEISNLENMHIKCLTLSWAPYLTLSDCNESGKDCKSVGYFADLMNIAAKHLNFTWSCDKEPDNNWGIMQISGPSNSSGTWGGIIGDILNGNYPLCISSWNNVESRIGMFDFIMSGRTRQFVLVYIPQNSGFDKSLFTRPFKDEVWVVLGIGNVILITIYFVSYWFSRKGKALRSLRLVKSIAWLSYLLVLVYYGGALKMFFTADITIPFESRKDVMEAYPDWKLKFRKGAERLFIDNAEKGVDKVYEDYWNRAKDNLDEFRFKSLADGVNSIYDDQMVIHVEYNLLKQYYKNLKSEQEVPSIIPSDGDNMGINMIVTENSPLGPILDLEFQRLCEIGIFDIKMIEWIGRDVQKGGDSKTPKALIQGQVAMIFVILVVASVVSVLVLLGERFYFLIRRNTNVVKKEM